MSQTSASQSEQFSYKLLINVFSVVSTLRITYPQQWWKKDSDPLLNYSSNITMW